MHRDIKLDNFMITKDGVIKIIDFGFSKKLENMTDNTDSKLGNRLNIDPIIYRENSIYGLEVDIYGLGCSFYALLYGSYPFVNHGNIEELMESILNNYFSFNKKVKVSD